MDDNAVMVDFDLEKTVRNFKTNGSLSSRTWCIKCWVVFGG